MMTNQEYADIQELLSKKLHNNPYTHTGNSKREEGYQKGVLAAKSILSAYYHAYCEQEKR